MAFAGQDCSCLIGLRQPSDSASALLDSCLGATDGSSVPVIVSTIHLALIFTAVGGRWPHSYTVLTVATRHFNDSPSLCSDGSISALSVGDTLKGQRVVSPGAPGHVELAALEQAQREVAQARCCQRLLLRY